MLSSIPGYKEAVAEERNNRLFPFLGIPDEIGGIQVLPLSCRHVLLLEGCGSPFLGGAGEVDAARVRQFLWIVSPEFSVEKAKREAFITENASKFTADAAIAIFDYVKRHFQDSPGSRVDGETKSYFSWVAGVVDIFASRYGWTVEYILNLPIAIVYQLLDSHGFRTDPDYVKINPSDGAINEHLKKLSAANGV